MSVPKLRFKADDGSEFPEWKSTTLGQHGQVLMCRRIFKAQTSSSGDVPFYKIGTFGGIPDAFISKELFEEYKKKYPFPKIGNILISASGSIGRTVEYSGEESYFQDSNIVWLDHGDDIYDGFLKQFYSNVSWSGLEGSTIKRLYNKIILDTPINLPSISEQYKIANFFSILDHIINQTQAEFDAWEKQKQGIMQKLFSQEIRFNADDGSEYPEWEKKKLSEIASMHARIGWQNLRTDEFMKQGKYLLVTGTDFDNGRINYETCHYVSEKRYNQDPNIQIENNTILVTKDGTLGKVALVTDLNMPATLNAGVFAIKTLNDSVVPKYLYQWLAAPMLLKYANEKSTGGTIKHLNQNILIDFPVGIPCKEEQQKISNCLSAFDAVIDKTHQELKAYKKLKKGLMQQMFI